MGWAARERSQGSSASEFHLQGVGRATSPLQALPLAPSKLWTSWLNSCLLGLGRAFVCSGFQGSIEAVRPADGGVGKSLPKVSRALVLLRGAGEPGPTGSPHLTLCSGKVTLPGSTFPVPEVVVSLVCFLTCSVYSVVPCLASPFLVTLGYFPQKSRKWERKTTLFIYPQLPFGH